MLHSLLSPLVVRRVLTSALTTRRAPNESFYDKFLWRARKWVIFIKAEVSDINPSSISDFSLPQCHQIRHKSDSSTTADRLCHAGRLKEHASCIFNARSELRQGGSDTKGVPKGISVVSQSFSFCFLVIDVTNSAP